MTQPQYPQGQNPYQPPQPQYPGYPQQAYPQDPYAQQQGFGPQPGFPQQPPADYPYSSFESPKPKRTTLILSGVIALLAIALVVVSVIAFKGNSNSTTGPDQIVNSQTARSADEQQIRETILGMSQAAKAKDYKKMATYFCAKWASLISAIGDSGIDLDKLGGDKHKGKPSIDSIDINGDTAELHISFSDGTKNTIEFKKESGSWKVCPAE